jgi:ABC-type multidrug transport system fused ATPase/permease subunit
MERLVENRTTFLISHRRSMLEGVDEILRVEGGRVTALPVGRAEARVAGAA